MTGLHYDRLVDLRNVAYTINIDVDKLVDRYFDFAEEIEKNEGKIKYFNMTSPYTTVSIPTEIKRINGKRVLACVYHGDYSGQVLMGECRYEETFRSDDGLLFRPNLLMDDPNVPMGRVLVFLDELKGLYVEEPSSYKEEGYIKGDVTGNELRADVDNFFESATTNFKRICCYHPSEELKKGYVFDDIKKLNGENVFAYVKQRTPSMHWSHIKGEGHYIDGEIPSLTINVVDKISCNVKLSDITTLDIENKKKDLLSWRPVLHHFYGVPKDVYDARMEPLSKSDRSELQSMFMTDEDLKYLYFGGDLYNDFSPVRNVTKVIEKIAEHGADEDTCVRLTRGSAWGQEIGPAYAMSYVAARAVELQTALKKERETRIETPENKKSSDEQDK